MEPVTPSQTPRSTPAVKSDEEDPTDLLIRVEPAELSMSMPAMPAMPAATADDGDELLAPGTMLGEYRVEGLIGSGGMGFVYAAVHPLIGKRAAVKVLRRQLCRERLEVERFINEARIVNQIGHPNIVDVFAFGQMADGRSYFVMEWLKGETLRARVARSRLELDEVRGIVKALASALSAAHEQGVIHRDLKPDNVFLVAVPGHGTVVKLLDFGIAKLVSAPHRVEQTASGAIVGTPQYLSPEQGKSQEIDHRTDTYAFGAIVFELLTGRPPFVADNAMEMVAMHLMEAPPRPSAFAPVPPEIDELVVAMLAKSPDERPALAEVAARFERARRPESAGADTAGEPSADETIADATAWPAAAGLPRRMLALIASLVIALAAAVFAVWRIASSDEREPRAATTPPPADAGGGRASINPTVSVTPLPDPPAAAPAAPAGPGEATTDGKPAGAAPAPAPAPGEASNGPDPRVTTSRPRPPSPRPPAAVPAPARATRTFRIVVEAAEYTAKIDGKPVGTATELSPGKHRLRVCARGKRLYEREIEIKSSDVDWRIALEPLRDQDLQCRE